METPLPKAKIKSFHCPGCSASVPIRALGHSVSAVCTSCGRIIDISDENYRILSEASERTSRVQPYIPLGQRGQLRGERWEVIGFMQRCDGSGEYFWREYLLFNPRQGFRWLTEAEGHWNYVTMSSQAPEFRHPDLSARYLGKTFKLFYQGLARVDFVLGEFYWRVQVGNTTHVYDYILPPQILSREDEVGETVWSLGDYLEAEEVRKAFQITQAPPRPRGVAANQPNPRKKKGRLLVWLVFLLSLLGIQLRTSALNPGGEVFQQRFSFHSPDTSPIISSSFDIQSMGVQALVSFEAIHFTDPISVYAYPPDPDPIARALQAREKQRYEQQKSSINELVLELKLIHEASGQSYPLSITGEPQTSAGAFLYSLPRGIYHLELKSITPNPFSVLWTCAYTVKLQQNPAGWSNFWIAAILLTIFPILGFFRRAAFESQRWQNSNLAAHTDSE